MKLVIDINEHLYKTIKTLGLVVEDEDAVAVSEAIRNGTPLEQHRNITNEEMYQQLTHLEAENERLHDALESQPNRCDSCTHYEEQDGSNCYECVKGMADRYESQTCIEDYPTCTECEHYDKDKHYCPRFCQVIKDTLAEAQPSEDCISRESVIEWLKDKDIIKTKNQEENAKRELAELPPVTPQRPKGEWMSKYNVIYECNQCGASFDNWANELKYKNYCPNCGSYNGGEENEVSD